MGMGECLGLRNTVGRIMRVCVIIDYREDTKDLDVKDVDKRRRWQTNA